MSQFKWILICKDPAWVFWRHL